MINSWATLFEKKLNYYFDNNYVVKDDQTIVVDCIINNMDTFHLIKNNHGSDEGWFEFKYFLL